MGRSVDQMLDGDFPLRHGEERPKINNRSL